MRSVEADILYSRLTPGETVLVQNCLEIVLSVVKQGPWHGIIACVGGQLTKPGTRKDIDIVVFLDEEEDSGGFAISYAIESALTGPNRTLAFKKLWNAFNGKTALYLQNPESPDETPVHLILPTHRIGPRDYHSNLPWNKNKMYAILAEF